MKKDNDNSLINLYKLVIYYLPSNENYVLVFLLCSCGLFSLWRTHKKKIKLKIKFLSISLLFIKNRWKNFCLKKLAVVT